MASISKYETYKPSGIDWVGDVPKHWEMKRFRYCFANGKGLSITKENLLETGIPCINYGEIHSKYGFEVDPDRDELLCVDEKYLETNQSSILSNGDFVFADTSEDIDGSGNFSHLVGDHKIFAGYHTIISRLRINAIPRFIAYYFESLAYRTQIRREVQGVKVYSITNKVLKDTILVLPHTNEQLTIANYLDDQTQRIDKLIANKEAQAEKLKELRQIEINNAVTKGLNPKVEMKDSGIDWLGEIPKHWEVKRLKNVTNYIQTGITPPSEKSEYYDGEIPWYGPGGFNGETILNNPAKYITQRAIDDSEAKLFPIDCIFMIGIGATIGKVGIIKEPSSCNQQLNIVNFKSYVTPDFGVYFLKIYENIIINIANFSTLPIYNQVQTGNLKFLLPPKEEQNQIANYLRERTTAIDTLIRNIEAQIEQLQELRKIKIYEAVTGKIKVNAYAEATA